MKKKAPSPPTHRKTLWPPMVLWVLYSFLLVSEVIFSLSCIVWMVSAPELTAMGFLIRRIHDSHHRSEASWPDPWPGSLPYYILPDLTTDQEFNWTFLGSGKIQYWMHVAAGLILMVPAWISFLGFRRTDLCQSTGKPSKDQHFLLLILLWSYSNYSETSTVQRRNIEATSLSTGKWCLQHKWTNEQTITFMMGLGRWKIFLEQVCVLQACWCRKCFRKLSRSKLRQERFALCVVISADLIVLITYK